MVAAVFCKNAYFVQIGLFNQDCEAERRGGPVIEIHVDAVGAWEIVRCKMLAGIVSKTSNPLSDLFLPAGWEIIVSHQKECCGDKANATRITLRSLRDCVVNSEVSRVASCTDPEAAGNTGKHEPKPARPQSPE